MRWTQQYTECPGWCGAGALFDQVVFRLWHGPLSQLYSAEGILILSQSQTSSYSLSRDCDTCVYPLSFRDGGSPGFPSCWADLFCHCPGDRKQLLRRWVTCSWLWSYYSLAYLYIEFLFCFVLLCFGDRFSLHSPGCPGTRYVDKAGLGLREIHPPLPPQCWD